MPITPQELIANLGDLPPLPQVAVQVLRIAADPDGSTDELQRVISTDQALTAQILKIANSAMFGMMREVRTLTQAIMTLGFNTIKSVVIAASAKNLYKKGTAGLQDRLMWEHALFSALAARAYARQLRFPRSEEAFLGALMHDIGKSVLALKYPERYGQMLRAAYNGEGDLWEMEFEIFGFDHAMVGEALLVNWNLAHALEQAVRWHHEPSQADLEHQGLVSLVAMGNHLALERGIGIGKAESLDATTATARVLLGLDTAKLAEHQEAVLQMIELDKTLLTDF